MGLIALPSNRPADRFYRGGEKITTFRAELPGSDRQPEDWVASTTPLFGENALGITVLPDGRRLDAAVSDDPEHWLGADHVGRFGADTKILVKLLDAGQRLPVHAHPHASFAGRHLGHAHGTAEAWYIVDAGVVHIGLTRDVTAAELSVLVAGQDVDSLLGLLHRIEVHPGDIVYVPPGMLHAIGAGVFLVEIQEPADMSILLEWRDFALDGQRDGHLGLGFDLALQAVETSARSVGEMRELVRPAGFGDSVLPTEADQYFRLERVVIDATDGTVVLDPGYAVLVVLTGSVLLGPGHSWDHTGDRESAAGLRLRAGSTVVAAYAAGALALSGSADVLVCRPPRAD